MDEVAEGVGGIITAEAVVVGVDFEDVFGAHGIVLEEGDGFDEARAAGMNVESWFDASARVAEAAKEFGPAVDAVSIGFAE